MMTRTIHRGQSGLMVNNLHLLAPTQEKHGAKDMFEKSDHESKFFLDGCVLLRFPCAAASKRQFLDARVKCPVTAGTTSDDGCVAPTANTNVCIGPHWRQTLRVMCSVV